MLAAGRAGTDGLEAHGLLCPRGSTGLVLQVAETHHGELCQQGFTSSSSSLRPRSLRKEGERVRGWKGRGEGGGGVKVGDIVYFAEFPKLISISALLCSHRTRRREVVLAES